MHEVGANDSDEQQENLSNIESSMKKSDLKEKVISLASCTAILRLMKLIYLFEFI